jgi:hypothetical protein
MPKGMAAAIEVDTTEITEPVITTDSIGNEPPMHDPQAIEILGRNRLVDELLRAGLEVALPLSR